MPNVIGRTKITAVCSSAFDAYYSNYSYNPYTENGKQGAELRKRRGKIVSITIPDGSLQIDGGFTDCKNLQHIYIPASVKLINAFSWNKTKVILHVKTGSYAEKYAIKHSLPFEAEP